MIIAFIGDVVGRPGRRAVETVVPELRKQGVDAIIVNLENAAGGFGITAKAFQELAATGVNFFTSGNHIWDKREGLALLEKHQNILRPANYPGDAEGSGYGTFEINGTTIAVFNIQGRVFMPPLECPFRTIEELVEADTSSIRIVDFHAEATSEKKAMGWYLDGRVSAVLGTHTHVATGDATVLPEGTAFVTDVGMTGSHDSILGVRKDTAIRRFLEMRPVRFEVARGDVRADYVVMDIDESTGKARRIEHRQMKVEDQ